jgi:hypothetical protein
MTLLQMVYRGAVKVSVQQMRAAIESLPYKNPKLSAVAIASMNERDFASRLERAIARSGKVLTTPLALPPPKSPETI